MGGWINEHWALLEQYWQKYSYVIVEKPVPMQFYPPQIPNGRAWNQSRDSAVKAR
jgi:hypothetical protein